MKNTHLSPIQKKSGRQRFNCDRSTSRFTLVFLFLFSCISALAQNPLEGIVFKGDVRLRTEGIQTKNTKDRLRQRLRGRLNFTAPANENVEVGGQLATSQGNKATSTNTDLGGSDSAGMKKDPTYIDTFYFKWKALDGLAVTGGKFNNPFYRVGGSEMIWDSDVTPEGVAINYSSSLTDSLTLFANGAELWSKEQTSGADELANGAQLGLKSRHETFSITGGVSFYDFPETKRETGTTYSGPYSSIPTGIEGYQLLNAFIDFTLGEEQHPLTLFADYVNNGKTSKKNNGYTVGVKYNKAKEPGTWDAELFYRLLEPNAVIANLADGDIDYGDVTAVRASFSYALAKNSIGRLSYLNTQRNASTNTKTQYDVGQLDFVFSF